MQPAMRSQGGHAAAAVGDDLHAEVERALAGGFSMAVWVTADRRTAPDHRIAKVRRLDQVTVILGMANQ